MRLIGIIAAASCIVIIVLLTALLISWRRGNKHRHSLTDERVKFEETSKELEDQITKLEGRLAESSGTYAGVLRVKDESIAELKGNLSRLQRLHDDMIDELEKAQKSNGELQSDVESLRRNNDATIARYKEELEKAQESNGKSQSMMVSLQSDNNKLKAELQTAIALLTDERHSLSNARNEINGLNDALSKLQREHDGMIKQLEKAREGNAYLQSKIKDLQSDRARLKAELDSFEAGRPNTVEDVIAKIKQQVMNGWNASISPYIRQNREPIIEALSTGRLESELKNDPYMKKRAAETIIDIKKVLNEPIS